MSEEEILNIMNKLGNIYDELKKDDEEGHSSAYEMQFEDFEAIQGLLDLYNKVKEKNKMLNDAFDRGWIHKDKIKELQNNYVGQYLKFYEKIQELLEEE